MSIQILRERLEKSERRGLKRVLRSRQGIDFSSNDYLGFCNDPILNERVKKRFSTIPLGSSSSRLLRGQSELCDEVEKTLARFSGQESALLFHSGYQANVGLFSCLLTESDAVFSDSHNHASIIDGIRLSGATKRIYPHRDMDSLRKSLAAHGSGLKVIVTESLFSMDGDIAPLGDLVQLSKEFSALLIVDEAHATGLWGDFENTLGGGIVQSLGLSKDVFATIHTGGKALGVGGAWIAGEATLRNYLIGFSRPFIFSTGIVPFVAMALQEAIAHWACDGMERAKEIHSRSEFFKQSLKPHLGLLSDMAGDVAGPIFPLILGSNEKAVQMSEKLQFLGYDVRAIRPPTVPEGSARIRVTLNLNTSFNQLEQFCRELLPILKEYAGLHASA